MESPLDTLSPEDQESRDSDCRAFPMRRGAMIGRLDGTEIILASGETLVPLSVDHVSREPEEFVWRQSYPNGLTVVHTATTKDGVLRVATRLSALAASAVIREIRILAGSEIRSENLLDRHFRRCAMHGQTIQHATYTTAPVCPPLRSGPTTSPPSPQITTSEYLMTIRTIPCILGLSFFAALASLAQTTSSPPPVAPAAPARDPVDLEITHDVEIGTGGGRVLHAEVLRAKNQNPTRAIIYVHGGGWVAGTYKCPGRAYFLARSGYLVASVEYRLSKEARWPAQIEDCKLAVRWLRANATQYHIDPNHIGIFGHSAGGHLVGCLGTMDEQRFEGHGGYEGVSSRVQAVVDMAGPADFTDGNFAGGSQYVSDDGKASDAGLLAILLGAPFANNPKVYRDASPICHIRAGDPPFYIIHGERDPTVSTAQSIGFAAALQKTGVPAELLIIKNGDHGLDAIPGGPPADPDMNALQARILAFFAKYLM